ncbi:MAG: HAD family phosphatase [Gemmatimonadetes bacterium]|jgi:beta-phosphoglucomutase-like phosphatase (HAD superfamily)|nr:HAD family phosphatase [Gemmatimonadota bacterium]
MISPESAQSQRTFSAACFDLDGTLIDTEPLHLSAEGECLATLGIDPTDPRRPRTFGMGIEAGMGLLADIFRLDPSAVLSTYLPLWENNLHDRLEMLPGAGAVLSWLVDREIPLALVTSGDAAYLDLVDSALNLKQLFRVTIVSDDVSRTKPDPMPYLEAAHKLHVAPKTCVGFEDSEAGIAALNAAGMFSVAVHPDHASRPELRSAQRRVANFTAVLPHLSSWFE